MTPVLICAPRGVVACPRRCRGRPRLTRTGRTPVRARSAPGCARSSANAARLPETERVARLEWDAPSPQPVRLRAEVADGVPGVTLFTARRANIGLVGSRARRQAPDAFKQPAGPAMLRSDQPVRVRSRGGPPQ